MRRWVWFAVCAVLGLVMLLCGLLVPAHLRAVDASVIQKAARKSPTLVEQGLTLLKDNQLGAAQLLLQAGQETGVANLAPLHTAVLNVAAQHADWQPWGGGEYHLQVLFEGNAAAARAGNPRQNKPEPVTPWAVRTGNRRTVLELLRLSPHPGVQELLRCRALTRTALFEPSASASGQALDAAIAVCGLLMEERRLTPGLSNAVVLAASVANRGGSSQPIEQILLDVMSLGQRFNWSQMTVLAGQVQDAETLRLLSHLARKEGMSLPVLFSAVQLSGNASGVANYLLTFSQSGMKDLGASLRSGTGGVKELLQRNRRLYSSTWQGQVIGYEPFGAFFDLAADYSWAMPWFSLGVKWLLYLAAGFLLAMAMHFARPVATGLEVPLQVRGIHVAREVLFALGFLLVVLLLSEPFLSQESQKAEFPFLRLRLPTVGNVVPAKFTQEHPTFMNQLSLLTLLLFFVLQALLYTASLVKLAEIRRQKVPARFKLKLLENEDHLFDAGLYLGFVGTIISLILVSLGVIKPSLMAAYSSTSFGIIFVSIFKIFHLHPLRRQLLLESEAIYPDSPAPITPTRLATSS